MRSRSGVWPLAAAVCLALAALVPATAQTAPAPAPPTTPATPSNPGVGPTPAGNPAAPQTGHPAASAEPVRISLQQALDTALQCHPNVISAQAAVVAACAAAVQARALRWPHLTLQGDVSYSKGLVGSGSNGGSSGSPEVSHNVDLALDYTVYQSALGSQIRRLETLAAAQRLDAADACRMLKLSVRQAYYTILADREVAKALLQTIANAERHRDQVQARIDAGTAPRSDLLPVEVEVAQARLASVQAETNLDTAYAALKALLQISPDQQVELTDPLPSQQAFQAKLDDLMCMGESNRPDIAAQKLTVCAAHLATRVAKIQSGLQFNVSATANEGNHTNATVEQWQLQVGATYPLFDAGASKAAVTAARANEVEAQEALQNLRLNLQRDVESAYLQVQQAATAMDVAAVGTRSAENNLAAAEARYREGLAIIIEVTDAQVQLLQAQVAQVQAQNNYATALAQLSFALACDVPPIIQPAK